MTDTNFDTDCDGWPEEYRDPRNRPHPAVLRVTVLGFDDFRESAVEVATAVEQGEEQPAVASFQTVEKLRKILTDRRIELLRMLMAIDGAPKSISAVADALDRNYRPVHDDVALLEQYGLLFIVEDGNAKRPYCPYERIHIDVNVVPSDELTGNESAPASA